MPRKARSVVPAEHLSPLERERTLQTIRDLRVTLQMVARRQRERVEYALEHLQPGDGIGLDPKTAMAVVSYTRAIRDLLEAHPGLEELIDDGEPGVGGSGAIGGEDATERLRDALRGGGSSGTS